MSDKRQRAIDHALRTTGTLQWCGVGVFSGDGKRALDPRRSWDVSEETRRYLRTHCTPLSSREMERTALRYAHQEYRVRQLAKRAIDAGKYASAKRLCEMGESLKDHQIEIAKNERRIYRINA